MDLSDTTILNLAQGGGKPGVGIWLMAISFALVSLVMLIVVLMQRPKGGGLTSAFGSPAGGGRAGDLIGPRIGGLLSIVTVVCFALFIGLAITMTLAINH